MNYPSTLFDMPFGHHLLGEIDSVNSSFWEESSTVSARETIFRLLKPFSRTNVRKLVDVGCGYGNLGRIVGDYFSAEVIHGVDVDAHKLGIAKSHGVLVHKMNVEIERLPFPDSSFDFVVSGGLVEHLTYMDNVLEETSRVLRKEGLCLFSLPNLASWVNRLVLLLGYQPRDIEISGKRGFGVFPAYSKRPLNHVHSATVRAFRELMEFYGFRQVGLAGWSPPVPNTGIPFRIIDSVLSKRPSFSRRFLYLGMKSRRLGPDGE